MSNMTDKPEFHANIREILGHLINKRLVEITMHDEEDLDAGKDGFVELMFEDGNTLRFFTTDNDKYKSGSPFCFSDPKNGNTEYTPTPEEEAAHGWVAIGGIDEEGMHDHCIPTWGRHHFLEASCWCKPTRDYAAGDDFFYSHNEETDDSAK